ncbi:unnamed protein product [Soboliphyme baturini]|uniref:Elf4 domain-containing protein n=1 Tax=Soboliphyme baturini TaxID=241478 RepID=A0A183ISP0_9BILA|nr:unnamed protein product [Soboliphyme baturini]
MRYSSYGEVSIKPFLGQFYSTLAEDVAPVNDQNFLAKSSPSLITMLNAGQTENSPLCNIGNLDCDDSVVKKQATRQVNQNIQDELAAVSSSVIALVNPYGENDLDTGCFADEASVGDVKPTPMVKKEVAQ